MARVELYSDVSRYEGSWLTDKYHGHGSVTMPDGKRRKELYANGELIQEEISTSAARPKESTLL
jgi:hypothetical protein